MLLVILCPAKKVDLVAFFEGHIGFFPSRTTPDIFTDAAHFAEIARHTHLLDFYFEKRFHRVFDFNLIRVRANFEKNLVDGLGRAPCLFPKSAALE